MKNFNVLVENIIQNINEGRIAHKNKKFTLDLDAIEKHLNYLSDDKPTKAFYLKMFNYLKNNPNSESFYTPESLKKTLELSLLDDTNANVAKSMAKDFVSYLNVRDVYKVASGEEATEKSSNDSEYSEDIAQEIIKTLQDEPTSREDLFAELSKKFYSNRLGGSEKSDRDFDLALQSLLKEKEIERVDGKYQIKSSELEDDEDFDAEDEDLDEIETLNDEDLEDFDDEDETSKFSKILADLD